MKRIIAVLLAAIVMSLTFALPASAATKKECNHTDRGEGYKVCLKVRYVTVAGHGSPDYHIKKVKLIYRSPSDDEYVGYRGMHDIDFSAREVVSGKWIHQHYNGRTPASNIRNYTDPHQFMCVSRHCRFSVDYTINCGPLCNDPDGRIVFVIRSGS